MKKLLLIPGAALALFAFTGCEANGLGQSNRSVANRIIDATNAICDSRGGTSNIALVQDSTDDFIATCNDGTNHFVDA